MPEKFKYNNDKEEIIEYIYILDIDYNNIDSNLNKYKCGGFIRYIIFKDDIIILKDKKIKLYNLDKLQKISCYIDK